MALPRLSFAHLGPSPLPPTMDLPGSDSLLSGNISPSGTHGILLQAHGGVGLLHRGKV